MTLNRLGWLVPAVALALAGGLADAADFHVAPDGRDDAPGTAERPFATIARARDAVRGKIAGGLTADVTVAIRGGTYAIAEPIVFGPADGGTDRFSVTYAAEGGGAAVVTGGRTIRGWKDNGDGTWSAAIDEVRSGKWAFGELFVNGRRRPPARHPNEGFLRVAKVIDDRRSFEFAAGEVPALKRPGEAELVLLHDWSLSLNRLQSLDANTHTLTAAESIGGPLGFWRINGFEPRPRYFLQGAREFLDAPGEWHLDRAAGVLTYRPMPGETIATVRAVAPLARQLLVVRGAAEGGRTVRNLRFVGLSLEHCAWSPDGPRYAGGQACFHWARPPKPSWGWQAVTPAVLLEMAESCLFEGGAVRHVGGSGIWVGRGCRNNAVVGSVIADIAGNGVMIGEGDNRPDDQATRSNTVRDCLIERCGATLYGAVGLWVGLSAGNVIAHNEIRHLPYSGVSVGWMWDPTATACKANTVADNHIHHVMQVLSDGGGIYTLGLQPGTVLRGNLIHDVPANAGRAESNGMFLDEGTTEIVIEGNVISGVARSPLRFHKAGKDLVRRNFFALAPDAPPVRYNATPVGNILLEDNTIVPQADAGEGEFARARAAAKLSAGPQPPWREKLPAE